jgi:adenylate cyclase class 2
MLEVEMKFPSVDLAKLQEKLVTLGAILAKNLDEEDQYFNAPDRDFAQTDEALRLRRIGEKNYLTYKGPRRDRETKSRTELELGVDSGAQAAEMAARILTLLGYRPVAILRKQRTIWQLRRGDFYVEVCLDRVDGLGQFVEVEIVAPESSFDAARQTVMGLAEEMQLGASERRSYLEMWLAKHHAP